MSTPNPTLTTASILIEIGDKLGRAVALTWVAVALVAATLALKIADRLL